VAATTASKLIAENKVPFSLASAGSKVLAGVLGVANLAGALWLGKVLASPILLAQEPILFGTLSKVGGGTRDGFVDKKFLVLPSLSPSPPAPETRLRSCSLFC
jgi:hypothetical protein